MGMPRVGLGRWVKGGGGIDGGRGVCRNDGGVGHVFLGLEGWGTAWVLGRRSGA